MNQPDLKIREVQKRVLNLFSREAVCFALAGGTALEMYYLHHRFSADLDFFATDYNTLEIDALISSLKKHLHRRIQLESEFVGAGRARVRFYTVPVRGSDRPLKIDFVEDVLLEEPEIKEMEGVRVYGAESIYVHKIAAIAGTRAELDAVGRPIMEGRREARDVFDLYMLSRVIQPLHLFLHTVPATLQRGVIHWYRTYSRQELKLSLLDMAVYDEHFNAAEMITYLDNEIKQFVKGVIE